MDIQSQEIFDTILQKDKDLLSDEEKGFLMARRSYLNDEQRKRYADMIEAHEKGTLLSSDEGEVDDLGSMSVAQLKKVAKAEGVDVAGLTKKGDLIEAIASAREEDEE